jgi:N-acyl-D-aspartate/D-glutamate deacylase
MKTERRAPRVEEMDQMIRLLSESLAEGSIGLSTGRNEVPCSYAEFEELKKLCQEVRRHGGFYTSHLRNYTFHILDALKEAIALGREVGVPVQLSHLQTVGRKNWDKMDRVLETVEEAEQEGIDVGIDAYPYLAGSCNVTQLLPDWSLEGGSRELLGHLRSPASRLQIVEETEERRAVSWDDIRVVNLEREDNLQYIGSSIQSIADSRGVSAPDAVMDLLLEEEGIVRILSFNQSEGNLRKVLTHPLTSICTDGLYSSGKPHPRTFGTYPTLLGEYVREKKWMPLEAAIHKISGLPAKRFKLERRGTLSGGNWADITVFDPQEIGTSSTYLDPVQAPRGIAYVLVNGELIVKNNSIVGRPAGKPLRN